MFSYDLFNSPTTAYRGKPFWAWNGEIDPAEVRRQIRVFRRMGMGGAFLHARVGLATKYLGKEWFEAIRAGVDECDRLGMEAWLYDEDCWPSGYAGGLVTKNKKHRMRFLMMELIPPHEVKDLRNVLAAWEGRVQDGSVSRLRRLGKRERPSGKRGSVVLAFREELMPCTEWYNGYTYLDTLSEEAVRRFIEITHEAYKRETGAHFGGTIPGIFTDEPNYGFFFSLKAPEEGKGVRRAYVPWTPKLRTTFEDMYGYDIVPRLPELFLEVEGVALSKARLDYRNCITHLFVVNFAKQIYDWCEANDLAFTGHVLHEESLINQVMAVGSPMRFYEYLHAPGVDLLTQYRYEYDTLKQCQSVVNQTGRTSMLTELYGCTGWDFSFEGHKAVGDWQAAMGANLRCHHLSWYTMKGEAKRDYPASISFQSPWWEHYGAVEDYFSRIHVALGEGQAVQPLLVIHPAESMFARYRPPLTRGAMAGWPPAPDSAAIIQLNDRLPQLRDWLLQNHLDFAYGDEALMATLGAASRSKNGPCLKIGAMRYHAALVPPLDTMRRSTLDLLKGFRRMGGLVVFAGAPPQYVDGVASKDAAAFAKDCETVRFAKKPILDAIEKTVRNVSIQDANGRQIPSAVYQLRRDRDRRVLFICNTDRGKAFGRVTVRVKARGRVIEYDPVSGDRAALRSRRKGQWTEFDTSLHATGSRLFVIDPKPEKGIGRAATWQTQRRKTLNTVETTQLSEPNALVLDRPEYRIGGDGRFKPADEILRVDQAVRDALGAPHRGGSMVQPWTRPPKPDAPSVRVDLRYRFEVRALPTAPVDLAIETPGRFCIALNSVPISAENDTGWWVDPCLRRIVLDVAAFKPGANCLELGIDFKEDDGLEAIFLLGTFGVEISGTEVAMTALPETVPFGDWAAGGLPFYGGAVTYRFRARMEPKKGRRVVLSAGDYKGVTARVLVNDKEAGFLAWPPYECDITPCLQDGQNSIAVELFGSRRNAFGPLHNVNPDPHYVAPQSFITTGDEWTDNYMLKPCGLMAPPRLLYQAKA